MTLIEAESAACIECDRCGELAASPDLTPEQLRRATGFLEVDGVDCCPSCAAG